MAQINRLPPGRKAADFRVLQPLLMLGLLGTFADAGEPALDPARIEFVVRKVADEVLRTTNTAVAEIPRGGQPSRYNEWLYQNFIISEALTELGRIWNDEACRTYTRRIVEFYCAWEPTVGTDSPPKQLTWFRAPGEMWHCGLIAAFVDQQRLQPTPAKQRGLEIFERFAASAPRLPDGTLVRRKRAPWDSLGIQIDDLYMMVPYWVRLARLTGDSRYYDRAVDEASRYHHYLWNEKDRLHRCLWVEKLQRPAALYWGRGNGWYVMAMTDLLQHLPAEHPKRPNLLADFRAVMAGVMVRQDADGLWHQLLDRADSFTESSCSGMFTYGLLKGAREGWLGADALAAGRRGWVGLQTKLTDDFQLRDVVPGTDMRDDPDYYLNRPRVTHDPHAIGPFLLAGAELLSAAAPSR